MSGYWFDITGILLGKPRTSLMAQLVKNPTAGQEMQV